MITTKQICRITITFPTESDEQAIKCKQEINKALEGIDAQLEFGLVERPDAIRKLPRQPG